MIRLENYRVIDLSVEMVPGELKIDGHYLHGNPLHGRPIELQEFTAYEARMHFIQGQTHTGTHAECPYKYSDTGADMASMPVESYLGEAVACNFSSKKPGEAVTPDDFTKAGVRNGDIVLAWGPAPETSDSRPYISHEANAWLIQTKIKLLGIENLLYSPPGTPYGREYGDSELILAGIPVVDALQGLNQIKKNRVFFISLPIKMQRVTATWTRAIALEEI